MHSIANVCSTCSYQLGESKLGLSPSSLAFLNEIDIPASALLEIPRDEYAVYRALAALAFNSHHHYKSIIRKLENNLVDLRGLSPKVLIRTVIASYSDLSGRPIVFIEQESSGEFVANILSKRLSCLYDPNMESLLGAVLFEGVHVTPIKPSCLHKHQLRLMRRELASGLYSKTNPPDLPGWDMV